MDSTFKDLDLTRFWSDFQKHHTYISEVYKHTTEESNEYLLYGFDKVV